MVNREYDVNYDEKKVTLKATGYKGINKELSCLEQIQKSIVRIILRYAYPFDKYLYGQNSYISTTAKCDNVDDFDVETGKRICDIKADLKYHNAMYNRYVYVEYMLGKIKVAIAKLEKKHMEKIERLERDLDQYVK